MREVAEPRQRDGAAPDAVVLAASREAPTKQDLEGTARDWIGACIDKTGAAPPGNTKEVDVWRKKVSDVRRSPSSRL